MNRMTTLVLLLTLIPIPGRLGAAEEKPRQLGKAPLCEPSAAQIVSCPSGPGHCLLAADNEEKKKLDGTAVAW